MELLHEKPLHMENVKFYSLPSLTRGGHWSDQGWTFGNLLHQTGSYWNSDWREQRAIGQFKKTELFGQWEKWHKLNKQSLELLCFLKVIW